MWKQDAEMVSIPSPPLANLSGCDQPKEREERFALSGKTNINIRKEKAQLLLALMLRLAADTETVRRDGCRANGQAEMSAQKFEKYINSQSGKTWTEKQKHGHWLTLHV